MLCPKCGKFQGHICFPPTPTCQCDVDYSWIDTVIMKHQINEQMAKIRQQESCCGDPADCNEDCS